MFFSRNIGNFDISMFVYDPFNTFIMPQQQSSNFHRNLSNNFDQRALDLYRFIDCRYRSDAKWSNNPHFNLYAKRFQLFPVSLSISTAVKGPRAESIIFRAKKSLLSERIRQTNISIKNIRSDRATSEAQLESLVGATRFAEC